MTISPIVFIDEDGPTTVALTVTWPIVFILVIIFVAPVKIYKYIKGCL